MRPQEQIDAQAVSAVVAAFIELAPYSQIDALPVFGDDRVKFVMSHDRLSCTVDVHYDTLHGATAELNARMLLARLQRSGTS